MKNYVHKAYMGALLTVVSVGGGIPQAMASCEALAIDQATLAAALDASVLASAGGTGPSNGGLDFPMWATLIERGGAVCAVASTGDAWPGSRAISAQKANTANAFSIQSISLSTANLFAATQPGAFLFGLQFSNPVDPRVVYRGASMDYGTDIDPMNALKPGGVNVFGGGLAIYDEMTGTVLGAVGVSGDTSCADHNVAWRVRLALGFSFVIGGVGTNGSDTAGGADGIIYDIVDGVSASGFGHPTCLGIEDEVADTLEPMTIL